MLLWMSGCSSFWIANEVFGYSAVQLLTCWCHLKVLPSRRTFCVHHTSIHQFTVSLYSTPHTQGACVFRCNLSFALLEERPGYFALRTTAVIRGWTYTETRVSTAESWPWRRKFSSRSCRDSNPKLYHWAIHPSWSLHVFMAGACKDHRDKILLL